MQTGYEHATIMGEWRTPTYHVLMGSQLVHRLGATGSVGFWSGIKAMHWLLMVYRCDIPKHLQVCAYVRMCNHAHNMPLWFCFWGQHINRRMNSMGNHLESWGGREGKKQGREKAEDRDVVWCLLPCLLPQEPPLVQSSVPNYLPVRSRSALSQWRELWSPSSSFSPSQHSSDARITLPLMIQRLY